jgi:hypothetical protein
LHRTIAVTFAFCLAAAGLSLPAQTQPPTEPPAQPQLPLPPPPPATTAAPAPDDGVVFVGAGDIANCELLGGARATAALLDTIPGTIFTLGDHAYPNGSAKDYKECYEPTWGRFKDRTHPVMGNHDLITAKGLPYWEYWGTRGGPEKRGYYSYELGAWHIIALNSTAPANEKSPQMQWLREDLATHQTACTLAYWHTPVFSSGPHGGTFEMRDVWKLLYEAGADVVLASHDHIYERFAPQDAKGKVDLARGIRQFLVGTGGSGVYLIKKIAPNSEIHDNSTYGVLKLTLKPDSYAWDFIPIGGQKFRDSGTGTCSPLK